MTTFNIRSIEEIVAGLRQQLATHETNGDTEKADECRNLIDKSLNGGRLTGTKHLELYKRFVVWTNDYMNPELLYESPTELTQAIASVLDGSSHLVALQHGVTYSNDPTTIRICSEGLVARDEESSENWFLSLVRTKDILVRTAAARAVKPIHHRPEIKKQLLRGLNSTVPEFQVACADALAGSTDLIIQQALAKALKKKPPNVNPDDAYDYFPYDDTVRFHRDACYPRNPVRFSFAKALRNAHLDDEQVINALTACLKNEEHLGVKIQCAQALRGVKNENALSVLNSFCNGIQHEAIPATAPEIPYSYECLGQACTYAICTGNWESAHSILDSPDSVDASLLGALQAYRDTEDDQVHRFLVTLCEQERFTNDGDLSFALAKALQSHSDLGVHAKLLSHLKSSDLSQSILAAIALADSSDPKIIPIAVRELDKHLSDFNLDAIEAFVGLLHRTADKHALRALISVLNHHDTHTERHSVFASIALSKSNAPQASTALLSGLADSRQAIRIACATALQRTRNLDVINALIDNLYARQSPSHVAASALALKGQFGLRGWAYRDHGIEPRTSPLPLFPPAS